MYRQVMCLMLYKSLLLRPIALDSFRGDSAFYTGCTVLRSIRQRIIWSLQGRRPPSSDVDAIDAENFRKWRCAERNFEP